MIHIIPTILSLIVTQNKEHSDNNTGQYSIKLLHFSYHQVIFFERVLWKNIAFMLVL